MNMILSLFRNVIRANPSVQYEQKQTSPPSVKSKIDIAEAGISSVLKGSPKHSVPRERISAPTEEKEFFSIEEAIHSFEGENSHPEIGESKREPLNPKQQVLKTTNKVVLSADGKFERIARGAAKDVWKRVDVHTERADPSDTNVFYTPRQVFSERILHSKEIEIKEELYIARQIKDKLGTSTDGLAIDFADSLAIDSTEEKAVQSIDNMYTVRTGAAIGDLGQLLRGELTVKGYPPPDFPATVKLVQQFFVGLKNLHQAGFVHGDIKMDNILVYREKEGDAYVYKLKLSDFGKTCQLAKDKSRMGTGNPRIAGEDRSFPAEVFAAGLLAIQLLEMGSLKKEQVTVKDAEGNDVKVMMPVKGAMLIDPSTAPGMVKPGKSRVGIESFVILSKYCPQTESTLRGKVKVYSQKFKVFLQNKLGIKTSVIDDNTKTELDRYTYALGKNLETELAKGELKIGEVVNKEKLKKESGAPEIFKLRSLLRQMLTPDRTERPDMIKVVKEMNGVIADFDKLKF